MLWMTESVEAFPLSCFRCSTLAIPVVWMCDIYARAVEVLAWLSLHHDFDEVWTGSIHGFGIGSRPGREVGDLDRGVMQPGQPEVVPV